MGQLMLFVNILKTSSSSGTWLAMKGNIYSPATGVWRSTDDGETWDFIEFQHGGGGISLATDHNGNWVSAGDDNAIYSSDNGLTWSEQVTGVSGDTVKTNGKGTWFITTIDDDISPFYRSTDNGATWTQITVSTESYQLYNFWNDGGDVWLFPEIFGDHFWRSTDDGLTWSKGTLPNGSGYIDEADHVATDGNGTWIIQCYPGYYAPEEGAIYRSTDNGATWAAVFFDLDSQAYDIESDGDGTWVTVSLGDGLPYVSTDNGANWTVKSVDGGGFVSPENIITDKNGIWIILDYENTQKIIRSTDNGDSWENVDLGSSVYASYEIYTNSIGTWLLSLRTTLSYPHTYKVYRSTDNGATWSATDLEDHPSDIIYA